MLYVSPLKALNNDIQRNLMRPLKEIRCSDSWPRRGAVCDADNFDTLLPMARRRQVPVIAPRDIRKLALALAHYQGVTWPADFRSDLASSLQPLVGLPLPAAAWESDILPARLDNYDPQWPDRLMQASALMWVGRQGHQVAFCHPDDLDLLLDSDAETPGETNDAHSAAIERLFPDRRASYSMSALLGDSPCPENQVMAQ